MENTTKSATVNPLNKYFRQPSVYMKLPSKGNYWPEGSLDMPVTGEIPIYPMTARDEITLRTPDALMNGAGIVEVIKSCCPSIIDAWKMPSVDVDSLLIAIRIASYGHNMDVDTKCPHCNEDNTHGIDLRTSLSTIVCPDYSSPMILESLKIKLMPQPYFGVNRRNTIEFEEARMQRALERPDTEEEIKIKELSASMERLAQISIDTIADSTEYIETSDGSRVSNKDFIKEFYSNVKSEIVRNIQTRLGEINEEGAIKPQKANCNSCTKEYNIPLIFDYASFFGIGS